MAKHKMTEAHYTVLLMAQDGTTDFGPNAEPKHHAHALDLMGIRFGDPMLDGVNSRNVTINARGDAALAAYLDNK